MPRGRISRQVSFTKTCQLCGVVFILRFKCDSDRKFCSNKCRLNNLHRHHKKPKTGENFACLNCRKKFYCEKGLISKARYCSRSCQGAWMAKTGGRKAWSNGHWKGGLSDSSHGYRMLTSGVYSEKFKLHHRFVMEKYLGRDLDSSEIVHHINGNKKDNRIENLEIMTRAEHMNHHRDEKSRARL